MKYTQFSKQNKHKIFVLVLGIAVVGLSASFFLFKTASASACTDSSVTPSNVVSKASSAGSGAVLCLSSGTYGQLTFSTARSSMVTLRPADGATVSIYPYIDGGSNYRFEDFSTPSSMSGAYIQNSSYIQIATSDFPSAGMTIYVTQNADAHIVVDGAKFINTGQSLFEGRLSVRGSGGSQSVPVGVQIENSLFSGAAGCSDGVQLVGEAYGVKIGPNNEFSDIQQDNCHWAANPSSPPHVDSVQFYCAHYTEVYGNYFHDSSTDIMAPDCGDHENMHDNVFIATSAYRPAIQFGHHNSSTLTHNVIKGIDVQSYVLGVDADPDRNIVMRDNVMINSVFNTSGCVSCAIDHNLYSSSGNASGANSIIDAAIATEFVGGNPPTTYAGYTLKPGSSGSGQASDHKDVGPDFASIIAGGEDTGDGGATATYHSVDLSNLISHYGVKTGMTTATGDHNSDGAVNIFDLGILLSSYSP